MNYCGYTCVEHRITLYVLKMYLFSSIGGNVMDTMNLFFMLILYSMSTDISSALLPSTAGEQNEFNLGADSGRSNIATMQMAKLQSRRVQRNDVSLCLAHIICHVARFSSKCTANVARYLRCSYVKKISVLSRLLSEYSYTEQ